MQQSEKNSSIKHLAHDLNNIFTRILNGIELLKRKSLPPEESTLILNNIEASTYLASEIITDAISETSKISSTRRVNLNSIIIDVVHSFSFQNKGKINFVLDLDENLKLIQGRFSDLYRIVLNLITNSIEAITEKGTITIKTQNVDDGKIIFEIDDTGVGITQENLPYIFSESFSTKKRNKISGVGLAYVKKIVTELNGTIEVKSDPNVSTNFHLRFPTAITTKQQVDSGIKSIIVAEDEDTLRELLIELLQSYNYKVVSATNGVEVIEQIQKHNFDLIIIDKEMPKLDGIECIKELRKTNLSIPIVLVSGSPIEDEQLLTQLNVNKILNKPYNFEEMLSAIRELTC